MVRSKKYFWFLLLISMAGLLLFLGETPFHTRGEPREAIVAYSMLQSDNWILPVNNGVDLAYKPPFFHWCIAVISSVVGEVNEYTSRMPSALALIVMMMVGFVFYAKRRGVELAFIMGLLTMTNFEVHRAGVACRVDMVLSAMMVLALYQLYKWYEKDFRGIPWVGVLCLSAAALTKGPVGLLLPCAVVGLQGLIRGKNFFRVFFRFVGVALLACLLPACWYWAAYRQGGEQFFNLVYEENVLRLMGKMSYSSHENPAYYNVITVVAGFVPYTLLPLIALFFLKYRKVAWAPKSWWQRFVTAIRNMDDARLFSLLSIVVIFVFYCIPKSKRSTYLLPIYPFIAYFLAEFILYLRHRHLPALHIFGSIMSVLSCILFMVFVAVRLDAVPESIFSGRHAAENIAFLHALRDVPMTIPAIVTVLLPCLAAYAYFREQRLNRMGNAIIYAALGVVFCIFFALDGVYQPTVLTVKSDRQVAHEVAQIVPEGPLYSYRTDVVPGNRMHPFTVNFYLGDRMGPFECFNPREGYVFMGVDGYEKFMLVYGQDYDVECVYESNHRSCDDKRYNNLYRFTHK